MVAAVDANGIVVSIFALDFSGARERGVTMRRAKVCFIVLVLVLTVQTAVADDLTGSNRILCAAVQASHCVEAGECTIDLPWNLNVPAFIEIDLEAKQLATTAASGENRVTPIEHMSRRDGTIVLQGFEKERAFSFVITESTGQVTVAVATEGRAVSVFGSCTPLVGPAAPNTK